MQWLLECWLRSMQYCFVLVTPYRYSVPKTDVSPELFLFNMFTTKNIYCCIQLEMCRTLHMIHVLIHNKILKRKTEKNFWRIPYWKNFWIHPVQVTCTGITYLIEHGSLLNFNTDIATEQSCFLSDLKKWTH